MVDGCVKCEGELTTGCDSDGLGVGTASTNVATEIVGGQVRDRGVVVAVLSDVLEDGVLCRPHGELLEDVMRGHIADGQRQGRQAE